MQGRVRYDHWIGGKAIAPASGRYLAMVDPATRQAGDEVAAGSAEDADLAVATAMEAQPDWARRSGAERGAILHRVADAIETNLEELIRLEQRATGKVDQQARMEVEMSAAYFRYYAGVIRAHHGRTINQGDGTLTYTRYEPYGVVAIVTPWNFPLNQACRGGAPGLAAGNAIIVKPSEFTSPSTVHLARLATEAGLPDGLFNVLTGTGPEVGTPLVRHPGVDRIAFTGSVATGRQLAAIGAERLIPLTLELGGKSPLVVFADADLRAAAAAATAVVSTNAGQVCSATTRLIAEQSIHDELVDRVVACAAKLKPRIDFGPIITEAQYAKVLAYFNTAKEEGAVPLIGGEAYPESDVGRGMFIRPTVYSNVSPKMRIAREEIFGPVLVTMAFEDEGQALALANDTDYGLFGAVWSGDTARAIRMAEQIKAGQVSINGGALTIETPLGGYKHSGYGREKGLEALHEYAQVKSISLRLTGSC
jgi:acyl-CoA reductase-like NAD-dependent aldehyde dehydrogenase